MLVYEVEFSRENNLSNTELFVDWEQKEQYTVLYRLNPVDDRKVINRFVPTANIKCIKPKYITKKGVI